jgi:predicted acetyltransferase
MTASEILVTSQERADAAAMLQDYIAEMAQFAPDVRAGQAYPYFDLYWSEPDSRWPFWLKLDDASAGFAFVRRDEAGMQMAEFFVARQCRCRGVGRGAARRLIARFPGRWRITQRESNRPAIAFWHRVLDGFAAYDEVTTATDAVRREQRFTFPWSTLPTE